MTRDELDKVLADHQKWVQGDGVSRANLYGANLTRANLYGANLTRANLDGANLYGANLYEASLDGANLYGASLDGANLDGANLYGANLTRANLTRANLYGANLYGANLYGANLYGANLYEASLPGFQLPAGDLIVYKKLNHSIATLKIESHTQRTATLVGRKCRAASAFVLSLGGRSEDTAMHNGHVYRVGEYVYPDSYNDDIRIECTHGIHFLLTREEAEAY